MTLAVIAAIPKFCSMAGKAAGCSRCVSGSRAYGRSLKPVLSLDLSENRYSFRSTIDETFEEVSKSAHDEMPSDETLSHGVMSSFHNYRYSHDAYNDPKSAAE